MPQTAWDRLRTRRIYFGHQSVGYNVLAGAEAILARRPAIGLRIHEAAEPSALDTPGLIHSPNGSNGDPRSKLLAFSNFMNAGAGERADVAFFKLCYVDVDHRTDVAAAFDEYRTGMDGLSKRFPRVRFLHVTTPLTALPKGARNAIKGLLGRPLWGYEHNARRADYNARLVEAYGRAAVFDLAGVESRGPRGDEATYLHGARERRALHPALTDDGGHLASAGRTVAGAAFLHWLAEAAA
ncbi:MAG: hypothetical protein IT437_12220 [Phycisphaerales bacterium]|nr:hypothetical protein [Phycisphaerales bacterium]